MNDEKIDLKSVNKDKKTAKSIGLAAVAKKQKGPKRDDVGRFAPKVGVGGLSKVRTINWLRAAPLILIVALVGGFFVFESFASGSRGEVTTWYRTCSNREPDTGGLDYWSARLDKARLKGGEGEWATAAAFMASAGVTSCPHANTPKNVATTTAPKPAPAPPKPTTTQSNAPSTAPTATSSTNSASILVTQFYSSCSYSRVPDSSSSSFQYWVQELNNSVNNFQSAAQIEPVWNKFKAASQNNGITCQSSYIQQTTTKPQPPSTDNAYPKRPANNTPAPTKPASTDSPDYYLSEMQNWAKLTDFYVTDATKKQAETSRIAAQSKVTKDELTKIEASWKEYYKIVGVVNEPVQRLNGYRNWALNNRSKKQSAQIISNFEKYQANILKIAELQNKMVGDYRVAAPKAGYRVY